MPRTTRTTERIIKCADANMKAEGFCVTRDVKRDCAVMLEGKVPADKLVGQYVDKHSRKSS